MYQYWLTQKTAIVVQWIMRTNAQKNPGHTTLTSLPWSWTSRIYTYKKGHSHNQPCSQHDSVIQGTTSMPTPVPRQCTTSRTFSWTHQKGWEDIEKAVPMDANFAYSPIALYFFILYTELKVAKMQDPLTTST